MLLCTRIALLSEQCAVDSDENIMEGGVTIRRRRKTRAPVSKPISGGFYCAPLCWRSISCRPVSVCLSQVSVLSKRLDVSNWF